MLAVYFTIEDEKRQASTLEIPFPDAVGLANIPALVQTVGDVLEPLLSGRIRNAGVRVEVDTSTFGWAAVASLTADVQEGARFVFRTIGNFLKSLRLPTFNESKILATTDNVDTTDTDVAAFVAGMTGGFDLTGNGGTGTASPADYRGEDLTAFVSAKENFTRSRG